MKRFRVTLVYEFTDDDPFVSAEDYATLFKEDDQAMFEILEIGSVLPKKLSVEEV